MVQVSYPGVYIQEKSSGVRTITGVSTSIAAFFGRATLGPINRAVRCLSLADFQRTFGPPIADSELAGSVAQFFANGGTDCYVVRLADGASITTAALTLRNWDDVDVDVLEARARAAGSWGNGIRLEVDYDTPAPGESFNLAVIREEGGAEVAREVHTNLTMDPASPRFAGTFVSDSSSMIELTVPVGLDLDAGSFPGFSEGRRPLGTDDSGVSSLLEGLINPASGTRRHSFEISVDGSAFTRVNLSLMDPVPGTVADIVSELENRINDALASLVPQRAVTVSMEVPTQVGGQHFLRITASTPGGDDATVRIRRAPSNDLAAALLLGAENGGVELARRSNFRPAPTGTVLRFQTTGGDLDPLNELTGLDQQDLTGITIGSEPTVGLADIVTTGGGDPMYQDDLPGTDSGDADGIREKLRRMAAAISAAPGSRYRAEVHGYHLVVIARDGTPNEAPGSIEFAGAGATDLNTEFETNTRQYSLGTSGTSGFGTGGVNGQDGGAPRFVDYVGTPADKTGFHALDDVDLVNLMVIPADHGLTEAEIRQLWGPASVYAASRRAFLLVDPPASWTDAEGRPAIVQNTPDVGALRATVVKDHSAVFYPRVLVNDRGRVRPMGPSGTIAGLMARTDASRGVWKAPAGTGADVRRVVGLESRMTDLENGVLNKLGVNCLRSFPTGTVNWGARTLDGSDDIGSEWKYIPIRRLALFIEESLFRGTQWVVFEPNDEPLWANIRMNVGAFMGGLFRQGAFQGGTPDEAYFVKCDAETTTQADRNLGIVNIEVGFAPLKPAEFVVISIQQIAGDLG